MNAIILAALWGVVMMFSGVLVKNNFTVRNVAIVGLALVLGVNVLEMRGTALFSFDMHGMLQWDMYYFVFMNIILVATGIYFLLSGSDIAKVGKHVSEYYALLFFILCGVGIVASFKTLLMLFIGIEIITIPLYILTGSDKRNLKSNEASLKYFLMGAFSTGLMLMGIALIYGAKGTFAVDEITAETPYLTPMLSAGLLLLLFSMSFKVSAAPFHFWTPDVYDGAPAVFTSFMATVVKSAAFIAFLRLFEGGFGYFHSKWQLLVSIIAAATLIFGNITAVFQQSVKRMLAYSSIAQAGFMMLALVALNGIAREGLIFYTAAYCFATIGVFAILIKMKDYTFEGFNGLAKTEPLVAGTLTIFILSLAGIPSTAGFIAKFYMLAGAIKNGEVLWLVILAIFAAAVSVYYYFRVIQAVYFKEGAAQELEISPAFKGLLVVLAGIILYLGIFPQQLMDMLYQIF